MMNPTCLLYSDLLDSDKKVCPKVVNQCQLFDLNHGLFLLPSVASSATGDLSISSIILTIQTGQVI